MSIGALLFAWWGVWQLPWVQSAAARGLTSAIQAAGVEGQIQAVGMNWRGRWELHGVRAEVGGHAISARTIELGVTPWGLLRWTRGHGSVSHLEVSGLSVDESELPAFEGIQLAGWIAADSAGWTGECSSPSGWVASGRLQRQSPDHWMADVQFEWRHASLLDRFWYHRNQPVEGHLHLESQGGQWTARAEGHFSPCSVGPGDEIESSLLLTAEGTGVSWKGSLAAKGLWDREGVVSEASLESAFSGSSEGLKVEQATCTLPFATLRGRCEFGKHWVGNWSLETEELARVGLLYRGLLGKELTDLKGKVQASLDWHGTFEDCSIGMNVLCLQGQAYGLQADRLKFKARSVMHRGQWEQLAWNSQGSCKATHLIAAGTKIEQLHLDWAPSEGWVGEKGTDGRRMQGTLMGGGLWGGRLQISSGWTLGVDRVVIENLTGNLFGQSICSTRPLQLEALGPSWTQSAGVRVCELDLLWGQGRITGSSELSARRWKGRFEAQNAPLEWVGLLLGPLKCTGFGDLRLTLGGDSSQPRWHAELCSHDASVVLGPLTGNCRPQLTLDGTGQQLDVQGRVCITEARLGLNHLEMNQMPSFEVQWAGRGLQERAGRPFNVSYAIDLETQAGALCSVGPVQTHWEGALHLRGTNDAPMLRGSLHLQPGEIELVGFPLTLSSGAIHVSGTQPEQIALDIQAHTPLKQGHALITCTGVASQPCLSVASDYELSTLEMLTQLAAQAQERGGLETARRIEQAVAWLPKADPEAIQRLRRETGLDRMELTAGESNHEALQLVLGQQLAERVLVQLHQQMGADVSGFSIESGESFSTVQGRSYALQSGTGLLPPGRFALRWNIHY